MNAFAHRVPVRVHGALEPVCACPPCKLARAAWLLPWYGKIADVLGAVHAGDLFSVEVDVLFGVVVEKLATRVQR